MLPCSVYFFWGCYCRKPLPDQTILSIPRIRCKACGTTHAVIPAFLFAYVRYPTATVATYVEQAAHHFRPPKTTWTLDLADGPESIETLYRWLRRLQPRLRELLPALKSALLKLEPAFDLAALQESVLKAQHSFVPPSKIISIRQLIVDVHRRFVRTQLLALAICAGKSRRTLARRSGAFSGRFSQLFLLAKARRGAHFAVEASCSLIHPVLGKQHNGSC